MFPKVIFPRFCIIRVVISDRGSNFINKVGENLWQKDGVKHKVGLLLTILKQVAKWKSPTKKSKVY